ncbi:CREB3 regulatory factor-like [Rana temporaria]|uniref:CREB3 regulatory factor-like n=1 Tax=Rana temporaria TaxID=8407 RepID=UPI001AACF541|nr:CREB3 regulatory factor-like [Rana temporaria]
MKLHGKSLSDEEVLDISLREENMLRLRSHTALCLLGESEEQRHQQQKEAIVTQQQSPAENCLLLEECKDFEIFYSFTGILGNSPPLTSHWEQWDTYCEDLTKDTKLTSFEIWGTKEVDYLRLDDFSSPYQDEEVISKTPTLAQLNSEELCEDLFERVPIPVQKALSGAEMNMDEIDQVIIVGGATHVPKVQEWLLKAVGKEELGKNINADEAAAMGAVYQAAALSKAFKVKPFVVRDAAKENTCFCGAVAKKQERTIEEPSIGRRSCAILPFIKTQKLFCPQQNVAIIGSVRSPAMEVDCYSPEHSDDGGATPVQDEHDSDDEGNNRQHGSDVESPVH